MRCVTIAVCHFFPIGSRALTHLPIYFRLVVEHFRYKRYKNVYNVQSGNIAYVECHTRNRIVTSNNNEQYQIHGWKYNFPLARVVSVCVFCLIVYFPWRSGVHLCAWFVFHVSRFLSMLLDFIHRHFSNPNWSDGIRWRFCHSQAAAAFFILHIMSHLI